MKTIIMRDPVAEAPWSRFPRVMITAAEAEAECAAMNGRLPTSEEYDRLFAIDPWPHLIYEWTSDGDGAERVIRGGSWYYDVQDTLRASARNSDTPVFWNSTIGFRCARDVPDDAPVPRGWIVLLPLPVAR